MSQQTTLSVIAGQGSASEAETEVCLLALVLNGVTSEHSRRSYRTSLVRFFTWIRSSAVLGVRPQFSKALVGEYRAALLDAGLSPATLNLRLAPVRRLAREMADNGLLDPATAAAIERVPGVTRRGTRLGNWLTKEQANDLLNAPDPRTHSTASATAPSSPYSSAAVCAGPSCCGWTSRVFNSARPGG